MKGSEHAIKMRAFKATDDLETCKKFALVNLSDCFKTDFLRKLQKLLPFGKDAGWPWLNLITLIWRY